MNKQEKRKIFTLNALSLDRENIQQSEDGKRTIIKGYACHFNTPNHNFEVVTEDSFRDFFGALEKGGQMPVFNYQHGFDLIGGWDRIEADDKGLVVTGHLVNDVALVRDTVLPLMLDGVLNSLSTEGWADWDSIKEHYDENGNFEYYTIGRFMLTGISLVGLPADFAATAEIQNSLLLERKNRTAAPVETVDIEDDKNESVLNPYILNY